MKSLCICPLALLFLSSPLYSQRVLPAGLDVRFGGVVRTDASLKQISLVFTGHEFADGGEMILTILRKHDVKAAFFFTGDFYRNSRFAPLISSLKEAGHYLGAHSDKHLLYCSWEKRDSLLVTKHQFQSDLHANYAEMETFGVTKIEARYFLPPYEWYNDSISTWTRELGLTLVNFTPGSSSNADWTHPELGAQYVSTDTIYSRILQHESSSRSGLNGFILLLHIGADPRRPDPFTMRLDELLVELKRRGYTFASLNHTIRLTD